MMLIPLALLAVGCHPGTGVAYSNESSSRQGPETSIMVDASSSTPISPYIYGANQPDWDKEGPLFTFVRQGGNRMTA